MTGAGGRGGGVRGATGAALPAGLGEVVPAVFWGEDGGPTAAGAPEAEEGSALARLREPAWWEGETSLLPLLRDLYGVVAEQAGAALRALTPPARGEAALAQPPPQGHPAGAVPVPQVRTEAPQPAPAATLADPPPAAPVAPLHVPRPRPLMLPGLDEAMQGQGGRRR